MKTVTILIVVWLGLCSVQAQQITEKHISFSGKESLTLDIQIADSICLHTWNKNEVYMTASVNINNDKDNEAYIITFDETGKAVKVDARFKDKYFKGKNNCCNETDIYWQVFMPDNTVFSLETINGNVTIEGKTEEMKVKSISGFIDLAVPSNHKADIDFSTISGTIFTNHQFALNKMHTGVPTRISEKLNNGGVPIRLETISGDIFFRKSE